MGVKKTSSACLLLKPLVDNHLWINQAVRLPQVYVTMKNAWNQTANTDALMHEYLPVDK